MAKPAFAAPTGSMGERTVIVIEREVAAINVIAGDPIFFHAIGELLVPAALVFNNCRMSRPLWAVYSLIEITAGVLGRDWLPPLLIEASRARVVLIDQ